MSYADILVCVDGSDQAEQTFSLAIELSHQFNARLSAIHPIQTLAILPYAGMAAGTIIIHDYLEAQKEQAELNRKKYYKQADNESMSLNWLDPVGDPTELVLDASRTVDLTILTQGDSESRQSTVRGLSNGILLDSSCPSLIVPYVASPTLPIKRVLVAWDNSRSAARAVNDALPFLRAADSVEVTTIYEVNKLPTTTGSDNDKICEHLNRQGVATNGSSLPHTDIDIGNTLLNHVSDTGADLLVMGAYGHSRLREIVFGGATRTILSSMTIPVLMSH